MNRIWQAAGGIATALLLAALWSPATAAGRISSVDPSSVQQGDTVLLTIKGDGLPTGNIRLEFFPQQIAVVSATPASANEITAQVRVPALATPGAYNVMVSNQLGEEAFGQALLTVTSTIRTPVFKNHDPKVIARADSGFALMLSGESITAEAAPHLSVSWEQNGAAVGGLQTVFSYAAGNIICAVTGQLPTGMLRGKISMAGKPIYQLEVEVRGGTTVIGHAPASINTLAGPMTIRLVGDDLSAGWLSRAKVALRAGRKEIAAARVAVRDSATAEVSFNGPVPTGEWTVTVTVDGVAVYQGSLTVLPALQVPQQPEIPQPVGPLTPTEVPEVVESSTVIKGTPVALPQGEVLSVIGEYNAVGDPALPDANEPDPMELPDNFQMTEVQIAPLEQPANTGAARIRKASFVPGAGSTPSRLVLSGDGLTPEMLEQLEVAITHRGGQVTPQFSSAGAGEFTFLFPATGPLQDATVVAKHSAGALPAFRQRLVIQMSAVPAVLETENLAAPEAPDAIASIEGPVLVDKSGFALTLGGVPEGIDWTTVSLKSSHPILAPNTGKFTVESPLSGSRTLLYLRRDTAALPEGIYDVLAESLCDGASIPLRFELADGRTIETSGTFQRAVEDQEADIVQEESLLQIVKGIRN